MKAGRPSKLLQQVEDKTTISKLSCHIDSKFYKTMKQFALDHDLTITDLIHKSLNEYMTNYKNE